MATRTWYLSLSVLVVATLIANPATACVIYFNDFQDTSDPLSKWSNTSTDVTPGTILHPADRFLGKFDNHTVSLTLDSLPPHTEITLSFDLYAISSWDGISNYCCGPDQWFLNVVGGQTLLHTTFSNTLGTNDQSYPDSYPGGGQYPAFTGAIENNTLGYPADTAGDSVYHLQFTFAHSQASLVLQFGASVVPSYFGPPPYPGWLDECWGLDNIVVETPDLPVSVDIKPGSCPNPLNVKGKGSIAVAVVGTADLDVTEIDPATITLAGISPITWAYDNVTQPEGDNKDCYTCFDATDPANFNCDLDGDLIVDSYCGDEYMDLVLKFDVQALAVAIGPVLRDQCMVLDLTGNMKEEAGGACIAGSDSVLIKTK